MRTKSLVIGYVLALALFLFAQRRPGLTQPADFHSVVDLTSPNSGAEPPTGRRTLPSENSERHFTKSAQESSKTSLYAPAAVTRGLWTVDQIPAERLIGNLVVLDVRVNVKKYPDYQLSVRDVAEFERAHGEIPPGSVVMALTGISGTSHQNSAARPGYSPDAAKFLVEGRDVVALGTDSDSVDSGLSTGRPVYNYTLSRDTYLLENVAELDRVPAGGGIVMVAPPKLGNLTNAPVRILALAR